MSDIREARFSETPLAPLKTLATESATVGVSVSVLNPAKTLPMTSEGTTLSSANFPAPLLTESAIETSSDSDLGTALFTTSEIATASERIAVAILLCSTRSDISEEMFSEIPLAPPKSLLAASEIGGASDKDFTRPLFTTSEIVDARFSDVVLNPVKSLDAASEMMGVSASERAPVKSLAIASDTVGLSASPLNPVKSLLAASEIGGASDRDFTRPLFTIPAIAETRLSDVVRTPLKALATPSDIADPGLSEVVLAPVKALPRMSEGTMLASGNLPAPLLSETVIGTTSDRDFVRPLATTSEIVDARFSDVVLTPVKALPRVSEATMLASGNLPAPLLSETALLTTSDRDFVRPLATTSEIVDARFADEVPTPVNALPRIPEGTMLASGHLTAP